MVEDQERRQLTKTRVNRARRAIVSVIRDEHDMYVTARKTNLEADERDSRGVQQRLHLDHRIFFDECVIVPRTHVTVQADPAYRSSAQQNRVTLDL